MTTHVSTQRRFAFIHVAKNGGISISECLQRDAPLHPLNQKVIRSGFQLLRDIRLADPFRYTRGSILPEHANVRHVEEIAGIDLRDFFVFGAIRNPWEREVSKYVYTKRHLRSRYFKRVYWRSHNLSFREVLRLQLREAERNGFRQQLDYFRRANGEILLSDYMRFETLNGDYRRIAETLDLSVKELPHLNKSRRGSVADHYDAESIDLVRRLYRDDIEHFGYDYPG